MLGCEDVKGAAAEVGVRRWIGGGMARLGDGETERTMGAGQTALASGGAECCTAETAAGMTERPGGGRLEKTLVGTLSCRVEVSGDACMCSRRFGATVVHGAGKRA